MIIMAKEEYTPQMVKITADGFRCFRCGHEWIPRNKDPARVCPNCKSPYWYIPKKEDRVK